MRGWVGILVSVCVCTRVCVRGGGGRYRRLCVTLTERPEPQQHAPPPPPPLAPACHASLSRGGQAGGRNACIERARRWLPTLGR